MISNTQKLTPVQLEVHQRLMNDFPFYAEQVLKVAPASGGESVPFVLNPAQRYMHAVIERQKKKYGWVRVINLKARRLGFSTYVGGRFFHKTSTKPGMKAFILSHHSKTTLALFNMTKQFHKEAPTSLTPELSTDNTYQVIFDRLNSEYAVGTAGSAEIGRGLTIQLFHGSEVAFWENTDKITAGVLQAVELYAGTEIIFESTANGKGNIFHSKCMDAARGIGDFELIFAPWYWHGAYSRSVPEDFELTEEENELKNTPIEVPSETGLPLISSRLTNEQIYWRRIKILEFKREADPMGKFKQEYPATVSEAFQKSGASLFNQSKIASARKSTLTDPQAPVIMGCDLARTGDRIIFTYRRGREIIKYEKVPHVDISDNPTVILASMIALRIDKMRVDKCFIDYGHGHGVFDNLINLGYKGIVQLVHFSETPLDNNKYLNKRAEIIIEFRDWLHDGGKSIPDSEELEIDLLIMPDAKKNARELLYLLPKDKIKELSGGLSTDILDSAALTFAYPVSKRLGEINDFIRRKKARLQKGMTSQLKTKQRLLRHKRQDNTVKVNWI